MLHEVMWRRLKGSGSVGGCLCECGQVVGGIIGTCLTIPMVLPHLLGLVGGYLVSFPIEYILALKSTTHPN